MKNLTPQKYYCIGGMGCPTLYATGDDTYLIVGKRLESDDPRLDKIKPDTNWLADDEEIIEVPADLFERITAQKS